MNNYINKLSPGDIIPARITHLEQFGAFADIGCGIASLLPIDFISVSRIEHPGQRFRNGMDIKAIVKNDTFRIDILGIAQTTVEGDKHIDAKVGTDLGTNAGQRHARKQQCDNYLLHSHDYLQFISAPTGMR